MAHRGPDDRGFYCRTNVALGHRRLSILDLSPAGHQPMCNEDGTVWVVFNGEIYNYKALRSELESKGHTFRSNCDTEVIVHAYEEYGEECAKRFDGMFAFGIWDEKQKRLVLARDHFGIKPLYYYQGKTFLSFASEIKGILEDREVERTVDPQALSNFLSLHYVPAPRTMFAGVHKLPPAHVMVVEGAKVTIRQYWELQKTRSASMSEEEAADCVYSKLRHSVAQRLQSDVPVGTLLSGGLDSSAVLGLMTEISGNSIPSFSVGYSDDGQDGFSEFYYARKVAKHFNSQYHEAVVTSQTFLDFLPKAAWYQDEPIGEPASIPLYYVCKLAKESGITVLLSGEGSDELFGGYNRHIGESLSGIYGMLPAAVHQTGTRLLARMPRIPVLRKGHRTMGIREFWPRYQSWHTVFPADFKAQLFRDSMALADAFDDSLSGYCRSESGLSELDRLMWMDIKAWLPDDLLMKKDKMGMATAIEARVPFLDHSFAQMAFGLPENLKVRRLTGKYIFKKSMERLLPREIVYRKKAGFPTPIGKWIAGELREPIRAMLFDSSANHGYFDQKIVEKLFREHVDGQENHERLLFPLLNFNLWHNAFFSSGASYPSAIAS